MFLRMITASLLRRRSRMLIALLSIGIGATILAGLVTLIELVNSAGGVDDLDFAGVERMRSVGNLKLYEGVLNAVDHDGLLGVGAGAGDEHVLV